MVTPSGETRPTGGIRPNAEKLEPGHGPRTPHRPLWGGNGTTSFLFALRIADILPAHPAGPPFLTKNSLRPIFSTSTLFRTTYINAFAQRLFTCMSCLDEASIMLESNEYHYEP